MTKATIDNKSWKRRVAGITAVLLAILFSVGLFRAVESAKERQKRREREQFERVQNDLDRQLVNVESGRQNGIFLYCTEDTDKLLQRIPQTSKVASIDFELTDVTEKGLRHLTTLPHLRKLVLYGGSPSVDNEGLLQLKGCTNLESLELINTKVTADGLDVLAELPKLQSLKLFYEAWRKNGLTDAVFGNLKNLKMLKRLEISGDWASAKAIDEIKLALPDCDVVVSKDCGR
jgi:hypothetical protein